MTIEQYNKPLRIGSSVKLKYPTVRMKSGQTIEVLGFVDGDENKVIAKGCAPGGWIPSQKLQKENAEIRMMTPLEIIINSDQSQPLSSLRLCNANLGPLYIKGVSLDPAKLGVVEKVNTKYGVYYKVSSQTCFLYFETLALLGTPIPDFKDISFRIESSLMRFIIEGGVARDEDLYIEQMRKTMREVKIEGEKEVNTALLKSLLPSGYRVQAKFEAGEYHALLSATIIPEAFRILKGDEPILEPISTIAHMQVNNIVSKTKIPISLDL